MSIDMWPKKDDAGAAGHILEILNPPFSSSSKSHSKMHLLIQKQVCLKKNPPPPQGKKKEIEKSLKAYPQQAQAVIKKITVMPSNMQPLLVRSPIWDKPKIHLFGNAWKHRKKSQENRTSNQI